MIDVVSELTAIHRSLGRQHIPAGEGHCVELRRTYDAGPGDVWDALTTPDRIARWFLPVSGDLQPGGKYQLEGNAGGEILACEPPRRLAVTWVFGENPTEKDISEVEVTLSPEPDDRTLFVLRHTAVVDDERWGQFGPGAVGVGWDLTLLGLGLHLAKGPESRPVGDPMEWMFTDEARGFMTGSANAWGAAHEAAGGDPAAVATAVAGTTAFYIPAPPAGS